MDHAGTGRRPSARLRTRLIFSRSFWPSRQGDCPDQRAPVRTPPGVHTQQRLFIMPDPSRRSYVQAKLKELIERASSVADANLHRSRKPYPLGLAMRAFILDHTKEKDQTIAQIKRLFLQHNVVRYVLTLAAVSQGKQFVVFTAEDESGHTVGHREIIVQPAFHLARIIHGGVGFWEVSGD